MTEETKEEKRPVEKHFLPTSYKSPFGNATLSQFVSFGQIAKLPKGETLHKYEMRLSCPIVSDSSDPVAYGLSIQDLFNRGIGRLGTEVDGTFKTKLFEGIKSPRKAGEVDPKVHLAAQKALDAYVWSAKVGTGKTTAVTNVVQSLVKAGVLPESAMTEITTNDELQRAIAGLPTS